MKKVFIGVGHGGSDSGAVGYVVEKTANLEIGLACADFLKKHGVSVKMSREYDENDPLNLTITECNIFKPDLAIDIHNNAGGGDGFEAFYHYKGGLSKTLALNIEKYVLEIGQNSRGCKTKINGSGSDYYGFIRETSCPAVICEGFFVDNINDSKIGDEIDEQRAFGVAYAKGILDTLGIKWYNDNVPCSNNTQNDKLYRVQVGAFKSLDNANKFIDKLRELGLNPFIVS